MCEEKLNRVSILFIKYYKYSKEERFLGMNFWMEFWVKCWGLGFKDLSFQHYINIIKLKHSTILNLNTSEVCACEFMNDDGWLKSYKYYRFNIYLLPSHRNYSTMHLLLWHNFLNCEKLCNFFLLSSNIKFFSFFIYIQFSH